MSTSSGWSISSTSLFVENSEVFTLPHGFRTELVRLRTDSAQICADFWPSFYLVLLCNSPHGSTRIRAKYLIFMWIPRNSAIHIQEGIVQIHSDGIFVMCCKSLCDMRIELATSWVAIKTTTLTDHCKLLKLILHMPFLTILGFPSTAVRRPSAITTLFHCRLPPPSPHSTSLHHCPPHDRHARRHGQDKTQHTVATLEWPTCDTTTWKNNHKGVETRRTRQHDGKDEKGGKVQRAVRTRYAHYFLFFNFNSTV